MYYIMTCVSPDSSDLAMVKFADDNSASKYRLWLAGKKFSPFVAPPEGKKPSILTVARMAPQEPVLAEVEKGHPGVMPELNDSVHFMTKKLYEVLKKAGVDSIDTYEAKITDPVKKKVFDNYIAFNITKAATLEVAKEQKIPLFRLEGGVEIYVHESIKKAIEDAGITTLTFYDPSKMTFEVA